MNLEINIDLDKITTTGFGKFGILYWNYYVKGNRVLKSKTILDKIFNIFFRLAGRSALLYLHLVLWLCYKTTTPEKFEKLIKSPGK